MVAVGHRLDDILGYSLKRIELLVELARKRERGNLHSLVIGVRHSQGTDAKVLRDFLKTLEE